MPTVRPIGGTHGGTAPTMIVFAAGYGRLDIASSKVGFGHLIFWRRA